MGEIMAEKLDLDALARLASGSHVSGYNAVAPMDVLRLIARIRAIESRASNAGGAVAWSVTNDGGKSISSLLFENYYDAADHARRCGGMTKPIRVYTHPAPTSKEPVADERAAFESAYVEHMNTQEIHSYIGARDYTGEEIASLREGQNYGFDRLYLNGCWAGWKMARAALATAQTWIPVSERLPECKHECTTSGHDVSTTVLMHGTCIARFPGWAFGHLQSDGKWICYDSEHDFMDLTEVTHWMPLPAAPAKPEGV